MSFITLIIIIAVIYTVPFQGLIPLSEKESAIVDSYTSFNCASLDETVGPDGSGIDNMLSEDGKFSTLNVLGDLDKENKEPLSGDNIAKDIDISKYIK